MAPVRFALMWHHHQPVYTDPETGQPALPWVRLHAIKDYWGMARLIERVDGMRATVNLVPCLLEQILAYAEGRAVDRHLAVARKRADELSEEEALFMLDNFFVANAETMIRPVPRYAELRALRDAGGRSAAEALKRFGERDLRDLAVLFDLVWFHPVLREEDGVVRELWTRGGNYSEDDRRALHAREREVIAGIIPLHKRLVETGRLELATSPYYHAILPLLVDYESIREAMPSAPVPADATSLADDASRQIADALSLCASLFGTLPRGMWPSEGAVSQDAVALVARQGVEWIVTDEEILERSLECSIGRSGEALAHPELLYRPYTLAFDGVRTNVVFRDHALSDLVGFRYRSWNETSAAYDLLGRLRAIGESWVEAFAPVVAVVLDGENAWEHYPNHGMEFLTTLYRGLASGGDDFVPATMSEAIASSEARNLKRVFAGSWIDHDFRIWGGHEEDRAAWEAVYECRARLDEAGVDEGAAARRELRIAEGSDWFWWYGEDHACPEEAEFDRLFRGHVKAAYARAGLAPPVELDEPIKRCFGGPAYSSPTDLVTATIDGEVTHYYEWLGAGRVSEGGAAGTMDVPRGAIEAVVFGCDVKQLFIRADFRETEAVGGGGTWIRVVFSAPHDARVLAPLVAGFNDVTVEGTGCVAGESALGRVLEMTVPWGVVPARPGECVEFVVERLEDGQPVERLPREGGIQLVVPTEDDVKWDWSAE